MNLMFISVHYFINELLTNFLLIMKKYKNLMFTSPVDYNNISFFEGTSFIQSVPETNKSFDR